jgi:hypothetical protein
MADAWSELHRYAISGALVSHIDAPYGRHVVGKLVTISPQSELLDALGLSQMELLGSWQRYLLDGSD